MPIKFTGWLPLTLNYCWVFTFLWKKSEKNYTHTIKNCCFSYITIVKKQLHTRIPSSNLTCIIDLSFYSLIAWVNSGSLDKYWLCCHIMLDFFKGLPCCNKCIGKIVLIRPCCTHSLTNMNSAEINWNIKKMLLLMFQRINHCQVINNVEADSLSQTDNELLAFTFTCIFWYIIRHWIVTEKSFWPCEVCWDRNCANIQEAKMMHLAGASSLYM